MMENEGRFLEIWRVNLQERCLELVHQAAKDVQEINERLKPAENAPDKTAPKMVNIGMGALMLAFQTSEQSNYETALHIKDNCSSAFELALNKKRLARDGATYAKHMVDQIAGSKIINMDELYINMDTLDNAPNPEIVQDLKDNLKKVDRYLGHYEKVYFTLGELSPLDAQDLIDDARMGAACVLLPLLQDAIKTQVNKPQVKCEDNNRPSRWSISREDTAPENDNPVVRKQYDRPSPWIS